MFLEDIVKVKSTEGKYQFSCDGGDSWIEVNNTKLLNNILYYTVDGVKSKAKIYANDSILAIFDHVGIFYFGMLIYLFFGHNLATDNKFCHTIHIVYLLLYISIHKKQKFLNKYFVVFL